MFDAEAGNRRKVGSPAAVSVALPIQTILLSKQWRSEHAGSSSIFRVVSSVIRFGVPAGCPTRPRGINRVSNHCLPCRGVLVGCPIMAYRAAGYHLGVQSRRGVQAGCPITPWDTSWVSNRCLSCRGVPAGCPIVPYHGAGYELGVQSWRRVPAGCSIMSYHAAGYQLGVQSWPIDDDDSDACSCLLAVRRCFGPRAAHRCFAGTES